MDQWTNANVQVPAVSPAWPHEILVKLFSSASHSNIHPKQGGDVLEIGCMYGNNLRYLTSRGHRCVGVEASADMVDLAKKHLADLGLSSVPVHVGTNRALPFPDQTFDILISVNTLHYDAGDDVVAALQEFRRILRPGGVAFVETAGAEHFVREKAERISALRWKPIFGDFRDDGREYGMFDSLDHYRQTLSSIFEDVESGRALEQFPLRKLEFYFAMCRR